MESHAQTGRKPPAIVIGLDGINGLQTARILARHQVPVIAIAKDREHFGCRTNCYDRILYADVTGDELISTLEHLGSILDQRAVLFPCEDMHVVLISRNRQKLGQWYHIILPPADVLEMMIDKASFYDFAQTHGFCIPRTLYVHSRAEMEQAAQELKPPFLLKPPMSASPIWKEHSKLKAYKAMDAETLFALYDLLAPWAHVLMLQEWIEGPYTNLYTCNSYFDVDGKPVVSFVSRKLRQWPPDTGEGCLAEEWRNDIVLNETIRLFQSVPYHGFGYLEMKCDARTGEYFIIEPNIGRPTGRAALAEAAGVELVYTMYCDALGWSLPVNREQKYGNVKWSYLRRDLQSSVYHWRRGKLTPRAWWQSVHGIKTDAVFAISDLGPFWGDLVRSFRLFRSPEERRKRDYSNPLS